MFDNEPSRTADKNAQGRRMRRRISLASWQSSTSGEQPLQHREMDTLLT